MRIFITKENLVLPFELLLDVEKSSIPFSTEVTETSMVLPGVSGENQLDRRYAAKIHSLVFRSWPQATVDEKDMLIKQINELWVDCVDEPHELHYERFDRTYYVKAVGVPERPVEYSDWLEFSIPLKAHDPYGYKDGEFKALNAGEIISNLGNVEVPARIEFTGPCTNPSVTINGIVYGFTGTVPNGQILRVDAKGYTVDFYNPITGFSTFANTVGWNGNFLEIPAHGKMEIQAVTNAPGRHITYWRHRYA